MSRVDAITALTHEGLTVFLDITILYKPNPNVADMIYTTIGENYFFVVIRPQIRTAISEIIANYQAKGLYSEARESIATEIAIKLEEELSTCNIILEKVLLRNIALPQQLVNSIEQKLVAQQEAARKVIEANGVKTSTMIVQEFLQRSPEYLTYLWLQKLKDHESVVYVVEDDMGLPLFIKDIKKK